MWLKESNRWKHFLVGLGIHIFYFIFLYLIVGSVNGIGFAILPLVTVFLFMVAVDWKDKVWGGKFDWEDVIAGVIPSFILSLVTVLFMLLL